MGELKTKKKTINAAWKEFIKRRRQEEVIELFGTISYDPEYDYKETRDRDPIFTLDHDCEKCRKYPAVKLY